MFKNLVPLSGNYNVPDRLFKTLVILLLSFIASPYGFSQEIKDQISPVLPPSPTASELGKYGTASVGFSDGAANFNIPVYTVTAGNLSLPVSLSYNSNGIKVDQIASRAGMGWMLSAGGVISRTVYGNTDETSSWQSAPNVPMNDPAWLTFMNNAANGGMETQPDIYSVSFMGYSGKFYMRDQAIIKLEENNLRITGSPNEGFVVTTPDGVKYYFEEKESSVSINNQLKGMFDRTPVPNAWFLTYIEHPSGENIRLTYGKVTFDYTSAVLHSLTKLRAVRNPETPLACANCKSVPNTLNESIIRIRNYGVYLSSISSSTYGKVNFSYLPREDVPGDVYLSAISVKDPYNEGLVVKNFILEYVYSNATAFSNSHSSGNTKRLFLKGVRECSDLQGLNDKGKYSLSYNDINALPPRLSYAKDDYGFFNGRNNSILIPIPESNASYFPYSYANRSPNGVMAGKGLLTKIVYPTGGSDSVVYEPNSVYKASATCGTTKRLIEAAGESQWKEINTYQTETFVVECTQSVQIKVANSALNNTYEADDYGVSICVTKNSGTCNRYATGTTTIMRANKGEVNYFTFTFDPGTYKIDLNVRGDTRGDVSLEYIVKDVVGEKEVSGVRVAKIISDNLFSSPETVRYYYSGGELANDLISYQSAYVRTLDCWAGMNVCSGFCEYDTYSSSFAYDMSAYSGSHIYYSRVTEGLGANMENGSIEHNFNLGNDGAAAVRLGWPIPGTPLSNTGIGRGTESETRYFRKMNANQILVKEVKNYYKNYIDPYQVGESVFYSVRASESSPSFCYVGNPTIYDLKGWDLNEYRILTRWNRLDSVYETNYDENGTNPVISKTRYTYSLSNRLISETQTVGSDGDIMTVNMFYPHTLLTLTGANETARQRLIADWQIDKVLEEQHTKAGQILKTKTNYFIDAQSNLVLPQEMVTNTGVDGADEPRIKYKKFDEKGNLLNALFENAKEVSYVWGYGGQYPVAKIENANYSTVQTVLGGEQAIKSFRDALTLSSAAVVNFLAPLRSNAALDTAQVTTYTYNPLSGVSSMTDVKGSTISYEYDSFQRLKTIRDQNGNLVKMFCYNYAGQLQNCGAITPVYQNTARSQVFTAACGTGGTGSQVTYTVAAAAYTSTVSQADADAKALNDITVNGQTYANAQGSCTYKNTARSQVFTTTCGAGGTGSQVTYTVATAAYTSTVSQADADAKALNDITANGQAYANYNGSCTYGNTARSQVFTTVCGQGGTGSQVTYTVAAAAYTSTVSQADADAKALNDITANGQNYANTNGACNYTSTARSQIFTTNCGPGGTGSQVTYIVTAGAYNSTTSQADADAKALNDIIANGQNYANANGSCSYSNIFSSQVFNKECPGGNGSAETYTVPAGRYTSTISQADADGKALQEIYANGQNFANLNGSCIYSNTARSQVFTKSCPGGTGSQVTYTVPAGRYTSDIDQQHADVKAQQDIVANGQTYANANGSCTYRNAAISQSFRKNCTSGSGTYVTYTVEAGKYTSAISLEDANAKALNDLNTNGPAKAEAEGQCVNVYAKRVVSYTDDPDTYTTTGEFSAYFYSNAAMTIPIALPQALTVSYKEVKTVSSTSNPNGTTTTTNYTVTAAAGATAVYLGSFITSQCPPAVEGLIAQALAAQAAGSTQLGSAQPATTATVAQPGAVAAPLGPPGGSTTCTTRTISLVTGAGGKIL